MTFFSPHTLRAHIRTITTRIWWSRSNMFATHMLLYDVLATNMPEKMKKKRGENLYFCLLFAGCVWLGKFSLFFRYFTPFLSVFVREFSSAIDNIDETRRFGNCNHGNVSCPFARLKENNKHWQKRQHSPTSLCPLRFCTFCQRLPLPMEINGLYWHQISIPLSDKRASESER